MIRMRDYIEFPLDFLAPLSTRYKDVLAAFNTVGLKEAFDKQWGNEWSWDLLDIKIYRSYFKVTNLSLEKENKND